MQTNIKISNYTIENYKNNLCLLKDLKQRIESGSFKAYDIALYNALLKSYEDDHNKKLVLGL